ncbi:hypothetical protein ACQCQL_19610, partial [Ralstonia pseudosolanacearum]
MKLHWGGKLVTAALVATLALGAAMDANAKRIGGGSRSAAGLQIRSRTGAGMVIAGAGDAGCAPGQPVDRLSVGQRL